MDVRRFAGSVLTHVKGTGQPLEISLDEVLEEPAPEELPDTQTPDPAPPEEREDLEGDSKQNEEHKQAKPEEPTPKPPEPEKKPEPEKTPEDKPEEPKPEPKVEAERPPTNPPPKLELPQRTAVQQHVEDKNQADNPNAEFLGDHANHVEKETRAQITSNDQNSAQPTPGGEHSGPTTEPGNAHVTDIAQSEDRAGEHNRAPGNAEANPTEAARAADAAQHAAASSQAAAASQQAAARVAPAQQGQTPQQAAQERLAQPDAITSAGGEFGVGAQAPQAAQAARAARVKRLPPMKGSRGGLPMLANGLDPNLGHSVAIEVIGRDNLAALRTADGERRRSQHRGSWHAVGLEQWRAAIENYVAAVTPGNQTQLNTAKAPFASYIANIHNRLHPIFASAFLGSLESLPANHPLNDYSKKTDIEIVLNRADGSLVKMGVTRSSGSTMFDVQALEAVKQASPFGTPPEIIVSPDGNVYLHWEFYRNPMYACSTHFARPYIVNTGQREAPPPAQPSGPPPSDPKETPRGRTGQNNRPPSGAPPG